MEQNATEPVHQKDLAMTHDPYMLFLMFGVPALAITFLVYGMCRMGSQCSREEEVEHELFCALEADLISNFNPEPRQSSSR
jgi:bacteriorhodopsin